SSLACSGTAASPIASASAADTGMNFAMTTSICKVAARYHTGHGRLQCRKDERSFQSPIRPKKNPQPFGWGFWIKNPGDDLLSHADAHYHRRMSVSLPSSEWDRVVPLSYC